MLPAVRGGKDQSVLFQLFFTKLLLPAMTRTAGLQDSVKVLAKSLVRNRQYVTKMHQTKANLQAVSLKITVRPIH